MITNRAGFVEYANAEFERITMDDFGTGYSSLSQLKRYAFDALKIDRSFVSDIPDDAGDSALVKATLAMARGLGGFADYPFFPPWVMRTGTLVVAVATLGSYGHVLHLCILIRYRIRLKFQSVVCQAGQSRWECLRQSLSSRG